MANALDDFVKQITLEIKTQEKPARMGSLRRVDARNRGGWVQVCDTDAR